MEKYTPPEAQNWQNPKKAHPFAAEMAWNQKFQSAAPESSTVAPISTSPEQHKETLQQELAAAQAEYERRSQTVMDLMEKVFHQRPGGLDYTNSYERAMEQRVQQGKIVTSLEEKLKSINQ